MATCTLQSVMDSARAYLSDTQVPGGEVFTNTVLQPSFEEAYRRAYRAMQGVSKRVQIVAYANLPANTTVLVPSAFGMTDFAEPSVIEERPAQTPIAISTTSNTTPITVTTSAPHGLGAIGDVVEGTVGGVVSSTSPWGKWFATITDTSTFTLNGSVAGGSTGSGGYWTTWSQLAFQPMLPVDLVGQGLDGVPQQYLGYYLWDNEQLQFRGASGVQQLRITYWASGSPPTLANQVIGIDDMRDFLACATAANAARSKGWYDIADMLKTTAYGADQESDTMGGMLGDWIKIQVSTMQRGPQRRMLPFRGRRPRFGGGPLW